MRDTLRDDGGGRGGGAEADAVVSPPPSGTAVVAHAAPHRRAGRVTGRKRKTTRGGGRAPPSPDGAIIQTGKRGEGGGGPRLPPPPPPPPPRVRASHRGAGPRSLTYPDTARPEQEKKKHRPMLHGLPTCSRHAPLHLPPSLPLLAAPYPRPPALHPCPSCPNPPDSPAHPPLRDSGERGVGAFIENCTGPLKARLNEVIPVSRGGKDIWGKKAGRRRGGEGKEAARTHTKGGTVSAACRCGSGGRSGPPSALPTPRPPQQQDSSHTRQPPDGHPPDNSQSHLDHPHSHHTHPPPTRAHHSAHTSHPRGQAKKRTPGARYPC